VDRIARTQRAGGRVAEDDVLAGVVRIVRILDPRQHEDVALTVDGQLVVDARAG
jgi:hypothetical protein